MTCFYLPLFLDNDLKLLFHHFLQLDLQRNVACWDVCEQWRGKGEEEGEEERGGGEEEERREEKKRGGEGINLVYEVPPQNGTCVLGDLGIT